MGKNYTLYLVCILILFTNSNLYSQSPQGIPYQGVARNASGAILAGQPIMLRMSVHDVTATGTVVYSETHSVTTTSLGQFSITIGLGTPITGTLASVNWGIGAKFLQLELSANGGSSYVDMGTTQFMSVPYALYAGVSSSNSSSTHYIGENYGGGIVFYVYDNGQHGLIAAIADLPGELGYGLDGLFQNDLGSTIQTRVGGINGGLINTIAHLSKGVSNSIKSCVNYNNSGVRYGDWYLPSLYELQLLYNQKAVVGGFYEGPIIGGIGYYSYMSSEYGQDSQANSGYLTLHFVTGLISVNTSCCGRIRPIRSF